MPFDTCVALLGAHLPFLPSICHVLGCVAAFHASIPGDRKEEGDQGLWDVVLAGADKYPACLAAFCVSQPPPALSSSLISLLPGPYLQLSLLFLPLPDDRQGNMGLPSLCVLCLPCEHWRGRERQQLLPNSSLCIVVPPLLATFPFLAPCLMSRFVATSCYSMPPACHTISILSVCPALSTFHCLGWHCLHLGGLSTIASSLAQHHGAAASPSSVCGPRLHPSLPLFPQGRFFRAP